MNNVRKRLLGTRQYFPADQERFAALSGDFNPLHLDPTAARRTMFGEPVVHGIHTVVWAIEVYLANLRERGMRAFSIQRLSANFLKPIFLREKVAASLVEETGHAVRIQVSRGNAIFVDIKLCGAQTASTFSWPAFIPGDYSRTPKMRSMHDLSGLAGNLEICYEGCALGRDFPMNCAILGTEIVAQLLSLSRLVGMECPGLNSLLSSFELEFMPYDGVPVLSFAVEWLDPRFSGIRMWVTGAGLSGTVNAFLRPPPMEQVHTEAVAGIVSPGEFAGQRALIIGGSRGLGEVTAKIIACGGGHPVITYRHGEHDAKNIVAEIKRWGGICDMIRLDVASPRQPLLDLARTGWSPTHVYYFATPRIFVRKSRLFDDRVFRRFLATYVEGFFRTYEVCRRVTAGRLRVFYPSSVAVDEKLKELTEYAAAKAAGETLCRHIERLGEDTRILVERLPRIRTDQTVTLLKVPAADASEVMCEIARKLAMI